MKKLFLILVMSIVGNAHATLIDFEDLDSTSTFILDGYYDLNWSGASGSTSWVNNAASPISGGTAYSGSNFAWSNGGSSLEISGNPFDIGSLWISSLNGGTSTPLVTFEGLLNGSTIFTTSVTANDTGWTEAVLNFSGIDQLVFDGDINTNLLIDDISLVIATDDEENIPAPAPASLALLGMALLMMRRLRKN